MQISENQNSINVFQIQPQQKNHQFTNEKLEDHNLTLSEHLYEKEDNYKDQTTFSQQGNIHNIDEPKFIEESQIQIFVQTPNGRTLSMGVNSNVEYLQQIKNQILQREGIPPDRQRLYLGPKFLNKINSKTIKKNSTLHLNIGCSNNIIVMYDNQRHIINVNLNDCVGEIKHQLSKEYNYPLNSQDLYFNNIQLLEDVKLFYYKIQKHSIVLLKLKNIIYINQASKNRKFMRNLDENQTILDLKTKLNLKYHGLGVYHLLYNKQILKDENILEYYKITHKSIIELLEIKYIKFSIETQKITLQIKKEQLETIYDIKKEIEQKLQFPIDKQHLFYKGIELENNVRIINSNIEEDSRLYLFNNLKPPYQITIIDFDFFEEYIIKITPNNKVYELKEKIYKSHSLKPPFCQILKHNGRLLKDEKDLSYYNIQNFDNIIMENLHDFSDDDDDDD